MILDNETLLNIQGGGSFRSIISNLREIIYVIYEHYMNLTRDCNCRIRNYK